MIQNNKYFISGIFLIILFIIPNLICYKIEQKRIEKILQEGFVDEIIDAILDPILGPIKSIFRGIVSLVRDVASLPFKIGNWIEGVFNHMKCGGIELGHGFASSVKLFGVLSPCIWEKFLNLANGSCTLYYLVDLFIGMMTILFITLPIMLIDKILGINLQILVDLMHTVIIVPIDELLNIATGFRITKWDDNIINKCYMCKGKMKLSNGKSVQMYKPLDEWAKLFGCSFEQMINGLVKMVTSGIPSGKWKAWMDGDHLPGWDNNPSF
jgi:hypothetical protein